LSPYALENLEKRLGRSVVSNIKLFSDDFSEMAGAASKSNIVLLACRAVFQAEIRDGVLFELRLEPDSKGSAKFGIVWLAGRTQSPAAKKAIELAEQIFNVYAADEAIITATDLSIDAGYSDGST
jgi:DNA-binding transcriptional LysR family regulator